MMGPYDHVEPLSTLIKQLEKGRKFAHVGGHTIAHVIMVSKGITILYQMNMINKDIR